MGRPYSVTISDGKGTARLLNGTYAVTTNVNGYNESSINPSSINVTEGVNEYSFTVSATGTLNLRVTEEGNELSTPVEGAKFIRCDKEGNTYGSEITSDENGVAVFSNVPFSTSNAPFIYYKQTATKDDHEYDSTLKSIQLTLSETTIDIKNSLAELRTINYTDLNYSGLPIEDATITLT